MKQQIGWIGLGRMGEAMVKKLIAAGHGVQVWNRTRAKALPLAEHGATVVDAKLDLAQADVVFTMVSTTADLKEVLFGDGGLVTGSGRPKLLVDSSSHGVNANIVHGWRKLAREREGATMSLPGPQILPARTAASVPQFLPVSVAQTTSPPEPAEIQIELRRGAAAMKITWPIAAAADCAAWMRALFIEPRR